MLCLHKCSLSNGPGSSPSGRANLHPRCNPLDRQRWEYPPGGPHHSSCNRSRQDIPPAWRAAWGHAGRDSRPRASKEYNRETAEFHRGTHFTPKAQLHGGRGKVFNLVAPLGQASGLRRAESALPCARFRLGERTGVERKNVARWKTRNIRKNRSIKNK